MIYDKEAVTFNKIKPCILMDQSGAVHACHINTGKNQSGWTNSLKCLRIEYKNDMVGIGILKGRFGDVEAR